MSGTNTVAPKVETALEWYKRSKQLRRRRQNHGSNDDQRPPDLPWWAAAATGASNTAGVATAEIILNDPALQFLWGGSSGIAPIDSAWKQAVAMALERLAQQDPLLDLSVLPAPPPPVVLLEGPPDSGKTWMLLTLAARFLVATRRNAPPTVAAAAVGDFNDDDDNTTMDCTEYEHLGSSTTALPEVIFMDSNFDFSISKLAHVIRSTLLREYTRKTTAVAVTVTAATNAKENQLNKATATKTAATMAVPGNEQQHGLLLIEEEMEECLSRIHVVQVDYGATDWVPVLEVLRHEIAGRPQQHPKENAPPTLALQQEVPTLLLWDGFLEDVGGRNEASSIQEIFLQMSRLLHQQECKSLWWVLSTKCAATTPSSSFGVGTKGAGWKVMDWMNKQQQQYAQTDNTTSREMVRVKLDRPAGASVSKSSAFAVIQENQHGDPTKNQHATNSNNEKRIPYSLSPQGILS
jgi:hypothetical protein